MADSSSSRTPPGSRVTGLGERFKRSAFARAVATLAGGTAAGQLLSIAAAPVLTRLFTPEEFGILAVYASLLAILSVGASARYQLAIPLPETDEDGVQLLALSVLLPAVVAAVVWTLALAVGEPLLALVDAGALVPYLWLVPVGIVGAAAYQALTYWAIRQKQFATIARTKVAQSGSQAVTQVGLGAVTGGPLGLLLGHLLGQLGGIGSLLRSLLSRHRSVLGQIRLKRMWRVALRYRRFPIFSTGSAVLNRVGLQAPALLLVAFYGPHVAGWFALGQRVLAVPLRLVSRSVSQVYLGEAAELAQHSVKSLDGLFGKMTGRLLIVALGPTLLLAAIGPWAFGIVFGESWVEAGIYARLLSIMFLVQFAVMPVSQTLNVLERQDLQLWWDGTRTVLAVGSLSVVPILGGGVRLAVGAYAASMALAYVALYLTSRYALNRELGRQQGIVAPDRQLPETDDGELASAPSAPSRGVGP